jgi:hypothetical protein
MEPIILELERQENDLLIIAHESVLRVLYGYLMACSAADIPKLDFPRDEIIEVFGTPILPYFTALILTFRILQSVFFDPRRHFLRIYLSPLPLSFPESLPSFCVLPCPI